MKDIRPTDSLNQIHIPIVFANNHIPIKLNKHNEADYEILHKDQIKNKKIDKQKAFATIQKFKNKPFKFSNYNPIYQYFLKYQYRTIALWLALITIVIAIVTISFAAMTNVKLVSLFSGSSLWVSTDAFPTLIDAWSAQLPDFTAAQINDLFNMQIIPENGLAIATFIFGTLSIIASIALVSTSKRYIFLAPILLVTDLCLLIIVIVLLIVLAPHISNFNEIKTTSADLQKMVFTYNSEKPETSGLKSPFDKAAFLKMYNHLIILLKN